jgi:DAK2 domain fusion protein YloV
VLKDAAEAAQEAAKDDGSLVSVMEAVVRSAEDSVARTPSLLPALRDAGVVDAGGQGLYVLMDGVLRFLKGESQKMQYKKPRLAVAEMELVPTASRRPTQLEMPHGYCTNFVLEGQDLDSGKIQKALKKKGQSLIVTGDDNLVRIHIHSFQPGEILNYATKLGKLHELEINNMDDQYAEFIRMQRQRMPQANVAVVTVANGEGFLELLNSLGNIVIAPGGQTMNPSVHELLQAVESAPSDNIILLPNNKNIVYAASQIRPLTSKKIKVIPTRNIAQGIAAFLAFGYDMDLDENARAMEEAVSRVQAIEIARAARETSFEGLKIDKGQYIAILNGEDVIAGADKIGDVIINSLNSAGAEKAELVTLYYGAEVNLPEAQEMAQEIRNRYGVEVETVYGGQPHYDYIISLE